MSFFGIRNVCEGLPPTFFLASATSSEMLPANSARKAVSIQNDSNTTLYLGFGSNAAVVNNGVKMVKDRVIFLDSRLIPLEAINVITRLGSGKRVLIQEFI